MNFSCDKCQRRYSIADEKVRGKTVKVRCKNCQHVISVEGPPAEVEESTRVVALADVERLREQERSLAAAANAQIARAPAARAAPASQPEIPWDEEPTRPAPARDARALWFAMVKSKQEGPLDEAALRALIQSGTVSTRSFFWRQGMADWKRGTDIPELVTLFASPPAAAPQPPVAQELESGPQAPQEQPWDEPEQPSSQQPWNEPEQPSSQQPWDEPRPQPAEQARGEPQPSTSEQGGAALGELFSDLDLPVKNGFMAAEEDQGGSGAPPDPLAAIGGGQAEAAPKSVEDTRHFMVKSGVTRRNPAWKIALFVVVLFGVLIGLPYVLTKLELVKLNVTRVDAKGNKVEQSVFSAAAEGMGELRDKLMGRSPPPPPPPAPVPVEKKPQGGATQKPGEPEPSQPPEAGKSAEELKSLYAGSAKSDVGPEVRKDVDMAAQEASAQGGPPPEEVQRVVAQTQPAFQTCIEQQLRKTSSFRGGKVTLVATVGASGAVKRAVLSRKDVDGSPMGECIKQRAKRMVFPSFKGEADVDVEIPLVLTGTL